jgi:Fe-S-cluster containining protein
VAAARDFLRMMQRVNSMEELAEAVAAAMANPQVRAAIADIFAEVAAAVEQRQPRCSASGKCCRFEEYGHRLYVTTAELAAFLAELPPAQHHGAAEVVVTPPASSRQALPLLPRGKTGCRFQRDNLCTVHAIRPFGCRMFYCDPSATDWQQQAYERFHQKLKQLHDRFAIPYFYVEWRSALSVLIPTRAQTSPP